MPHGMVASSIAAAHTNVAAAGVPAAAVTVSDVTVTVDVAAVTASAVATAGTVPADAAFAAVEWAGSGTGRWEGREGAVVLRPPGGEAASVAPTERSTAVPSTLTQGEARAEPGKRLEEIISQLTLIQPGVAIYNELETAKFYGRLSVERKFLKKASVV